MKVVNLKDQLVSLLEAERAGVAVARALYEVAKDPAERELMSLILDGERESCRVLGRILLKMGTKGSGRVGDFAQKVMALPDLHERLDLLIKGQEWVVRRIDEALQADLPDEAIVPLAEIRHFHEVNIGKCKKYLKSKAMV